MTPLIDVLIDKYMHVYNIIHKYKNLYKDCTLFSENTYRENIVGT